MTSLAENYQNIIQRISEVAGSRKVTLIAVGKKQPVDAIFKLYELGHRDFGENYAQELIDKAEKLRERGCLDIRWHFIGHLQSNKIKGIIPHVFAIHTVDSEKLAREISKQWKLNGKLERLPVFVEVNIDDQESKAGISPNETHALAGLIGSIPELSLQGLMCIPDPKFAVEASFAHLRDLELQCRPTSQGFLSMGMSADFETAIHFGATHVRVGTALFGERA